jgi:Xaa-Pro aminopeptidase
MNLRLQKLRKLLIKNNLDAAFISSLPNIIYLTNFSDFTSLDRDGFILMTKNSQYIFTHGIYEEAVQKNVKDFELIAIQRENPISKAIKDIIHREKIKRLGFENFDLKVNEYEKLLQEIDKDILTPTTIVHDLRIIKTSVEIKAIKKACALGDKAYNYIRKKITANITEKELAFLLEMYIKQHGAQLSFDSVIAFGPNASKPHHVPGATKLKKNNFVLLDFGVKLDNYCSDMTRTIFFGTANAKQKDAYQKVLDSQKIAETFNKLPRAYATWY